MTVDYGVVINGKQLTKNFSPEVLALLGNPDIDTLREMTRQWAEDSGNFTLEQIQHGESMYMNSVGASFAFRKRRCETKEHKWHTGNRFRSCLNCSCLEKRLDPSDPWVRVARRLQV